MEFYVDPFDAPESQQYIATPLRGRPELAFGKPIDLSLIFPSLSR